MRDYEEMDERTAQEYLERYVASLPELRERFARRLAATGGPVVDTSVEALADLDPWYEKEIQDPTPDGLDGVPLWWDPAIAGRTPTDAQLRVVDEVGAHLATVLQDGGAERGVGRDEAARRFARTYGSPQHGAADGAPLGRSRGAWRTATSPG